MARGPIKRKIKKQQKGQLRLKGISGLSVLVTERDAKIAAGLARHGKKIKALTDAGISKSNAKSNSSELINSPGVQAALETALDKANATLDRVADVIDRGLDAQKIVMVGKDAYRVDDHAVQHQFVRTTAELRDWFPDKKVAMEHSGAVGVVEILDYATAVKPKK